MRLQWRLDQVVTENTLLTSAIIRVSLARNAVPRKQNQRLRILELRVQAIVSQSIELKYKCRHSLGLKVDDQLIEVQGPINCLDIAVNHMASWNFKMWHFTIISGEILDANDAIHPVLM